MASVQIHVIWFIPLDEDGDQVMNFQPSLPEGVGGGG